MKYTCHFLIGILLLSTWSACERRLDIRLDSAAGIPVFYGVLTPDQNPRFQLFETIGALDSGAFPVIKNASIMLIENGVDTTRFSYDPSGYYLTDTAWRPLVGNR